VNTALLNGYPMVIPIDRLLWGGEHGIPAGQYARLTGDLMRPSTSISATPHVQLLKEYQAMGTEVFRPERFRHTAYFKNGAQSIATLGQYFTYTREDDIIRVAQQFVAQFEGKWLVAAPDDARFSSPATMFRVQRIKHSDCYEVLDG